MFSLGQTSPDSWSSLVKQFGVSGAMLVMGLIFLVSGKWVVLRRELDTEKEKRLATEKEGADRLSQMRVERDEWKNAYLRSVEVAERAVTVTEKTADKLVPPKGAA